MRPSYFIHKVTNSVVTLQAFGASLNADSIHYMLLFLAPLKM